MISLDKLKEQGKAPEFLTEEGLATLSKGYLQKDETPYDMYKRVSQASANNLKKPELADKFFDYMWKGWLCLATPVASNLGTDRGLPISCYGSYTNDTTNDIFLGYHETAMLTKYGGGIGKYWGSVRGRGAVISKGGASEGVIPWLKVEEATLQSVSQTGVRRGAGAQYLDIEHVDAPEFIDIRKPAGDLSRRCLSINFHHAICIGDDFMNKMLDGDMKNQELFVKVMKTRLETGEPYLMFKDTANRLAPECYKKNNLQIHTSQLCNEIFLHNDKDHTFVCCLSSLNLSKYDEWKNTDLIYYATWFLDGVMEEFIRKAKNMLGMEKAVRFSEKSRALGLGALGWHTLLQKKMYPFDSFESMMLNSEIFSKMNSESLRASQDMAKEYGEPEWCKGFGIRNTHRLAIAPTVSNSLISGGISQGIEPIVANVFAQKTAKGTYIMKNPELQNLLKSKNLDNFDIWNVINKNGGSVSGLKELSSQEKEVFLTAREINQHSIIKQAAQRQKFIDQGQSVNLFFAASENLSDDSKKKLAKYITEVHIEAWKQGLKGLYYLRSESILKGDNIYREASECKSCEG